MTKIPVGKTIARAYGFAFRDFFRILGVMWLPWSILWLPGIFLQQRMIALQQRIISGDTSVSRMIWLIFLPVYLAMIVILFMQIIGIAKLALGIKKGPAWFYFSLDKPVWRLIGSWLLLIVALIIGYFALLLAGVVLGFGIAMLTKTVNNGLFNGLIAILLAVAAIAAWCAYIYAVVRLTFLLVPVIAAEEEGFALARSWTLGLGNFWRMFVVLLAVLAPFIVIELVFIFGYLFRGLPFPPAHADPVQVAAFQAAINARMLEMIGAMNHYWYLSYPIFVVVMVVFYGVAVGAQCFGWRALTDGEASGPVAAD